MEISSIKSSHEWSLLSTSELRFKWIARTRAVGVEEVEEEEEEEEEGVKD